MDALKSALRSKTVWFSIILAMLSVFQGFIGKLPLGPMEQMYVGMGVAAVVAVLRAVTTQPLTAK